MHVAGETGLLSRLAGRWASVMPLPGQLDPTWDARGPAKQKSHLRAAFCKVGGGVPPYLWDDSSLGPSRSRGEPFPNTAPPQRARLEKAGKEVVVLLLRDGQRCGCLGIPNTLLHCALVRVCFFLGLKSLI